MTGTLFVAGAGLMGSGIAQVAAVAGWDVRLYDTNPPALDRALAAMDDSLGRFERKGKLQAGDRAAALARISTTTELDPAADAELVVEAVFEELGVKAELFARLDAVCGDRTVLATNTSAIPITRIAAATSRPELVVGTHFFSPVPMMQLCELVRGYATSDETLERARFFATSCGKTTVTVNRDVAGFVTTRIIAAISVEAARLVEQGVISADDMDTACKLAFGWPMGPLATMDLTGVDVMYHAATNIWNETAEAKFFPPEIIGRMVAAGAIGRKAGRGWFDHPSG